MNEFLEGFAERRRDGLGGFGRDLARVRMGLGLVNVFQFGPRISRTHIKLSKINNLLKIMYFASYFTLCLIMISIQVKKLIYLFEPPRLPKELTKLVQMKVTLYSGLILN